MLKLNIRSLSFFSHVTFLLIVLSINATMLYILNNYSIAKYTFWWDFSNAVSSSETQLNCMKYNYVAQSIIYYVEQNADLMRFLEKHQIKDKCTWSMYRSSIDVKVPIIDDNSDPIPETTSMHLLRVQYTRRASWRSYESRMTIHLSRSSVISAICMSPNLWVQPNIFITFSVYKV